MTFTHGIGFANAATQIGTKYANGTLYVSSPSSSLIQDDDEPLPTEEDNRVIEPTWTITFMISYVLKWFFTTVTAILKLFCTTVTAILPPPLPSCIRSIHRIWKAIAFASDYLFGDSFFIPIKATGMIPISLFGMYRAVTRVVLSIVFWVDFKQTPIVIRLYQQICIILGCPLKVIIAFVMKEMLDFLINQSEFKAELNAGHDFLIFYLTVTIWQNRRIVMDRFVEILGGIPRRP